MNRDAMRWIMWSAILLILGGALRPGNAAPVDGVAVQFGRETAPKRRRLVSQSKAQLMIVTRPENGEPMMQPLMNVEVTDMRRDEETSLKPLAFRVHYEKYKVETTMAGQEAKSESQGVDGRTYQVTFGVGPVPEPKPAGSEKESKRLREDYAREFLVRNAIFPVKGSLVRANERSPVVERVLHAMMESNPAKPKADTRVISCEAKLTGQEVADGVPVARFAIKIKLAVRITPEVEFFIDSEGALLLRIADAAPVLLETDDDVTSTPAFKDGVERYMGGQGKTSTRITYGPSVPAVPTPESVAAGVRIRD